MLTLDASPKFYTILLFIDIFFLSLVQVMSDIVSIGTYVSVLFNYVEMHRSCFYISNVQFWVLHGQKSDLHGQRLSLRWYIVQMGHLSILMWVKVHHNQNTFTVFEFLNFTLFDQKMIKNLFSMMKQFWKAQRESIPTYDLQIRRYIALKLILSLYQLSAKI